MCHPNGLLFHQKSLNMGPILVKKSLEEGPISQKLQKKKKKKNVKSTIFEVVKPLRSGSRFVKILSQKQKQNIKSAFFEGEKSLDMGRGFRPWTAHPVKNNLSTSTPRALNMEVWRIMFPAIWYQIYHRTIIKIGWNWQNFMTTVVD